MSRLARARRRTDAEVAGGRHRRDAGQLERAQVAENAPLVTVVDLTALEIEFQVSESYANEIRSGMSAEVTLDGRQLVGTVAGISPDVTQLRRSPAACASSTQPKGLRQNQRASVRIVLDERSDVLKVARSPFNDSDTRFVYVVRDDAAGPHAGRIRRGGHRRNRDPQWTQCRRHRRALRHARLQATPPASSSVTKRNDPMLSMKNVSKVFRTDLIETHALRDFSLEVKRG